MSTLLVVEDEAKMRRLLELNLTEEGYTVLTAADAEAGLNILRQEKIDLIVTDLKLPGMNGLEFLQAIKRTNATLPVVVMTAFGTVETAVEAMKAGASDVCAEALRPGGNQAHPPQRVGRSSPARGEPLAA